MSGKEKNKGGRPSRYKAEYVEQAYRLCLLGATDAEMADFFQVGISSFNRWKSAHSEFRDALKRGKLEADAKVAQSLYWRARGYHHPEDDIRSVNGEIVITPTIKHYPPDTTAAIFWLKNRQTREWRDKREIEAKVTTQELPASIDEFV